MSQETLETAPGLSRMETRRALKLWTVEGCIATVQVVLTSGGFQTQYALFLGCTDFVIGLLAAFPAFAGLLQLAASSFGPKLGPRKQVVSWFALASRLLWVPMLLIPFILPQSGWVGTFLTLTVLGSVLGNVAAPLWMGWISDLVPADYRGRYFGRKNLYGGVVSLIVPVLGGAFLDLAVKRHLMSVPVGYAALFGFATLFAFGSFAVGMRSPDVPRPTLPESSPHNLGGLRALLTDYAAPFQDANFRRYMQFSAGFAFAQTCAGQFFVVYQLKPLALTNTAFQLVSAAATFASLASMPLWGYLADKYGNKPILMIGCAIVILPPFLWLLPDYDGIAGLWAYGAGGALHVSYTKLIITFLNLVAGFGWAGVGLTQFNLMIGAAPAERRTVYISATAAVNGIVTGIAPLLGGALLEILKPVHFPAHGLIRNNYHVLFIVSGLLRLLFLFALRPVKETGSSTARYVLEQLKATPPIGSIANIQKLARAGSAQARQHAAGELAKLKTPVAVEELVRALDDVALPVREQAAVALGEIGDARAVSSLVGKLTDPASGITGAAATALGKIGDKAAFPSLAAAAQLGPANRQLAAVEALGHLTDARVSGLLAALMSDRDASVRTAATRALSEREDPETAPALTARLTAESDPATLAMLADALGRLGEPSSVPALLDALRRSVSPTVRREIMNAIGSVTGGRDSFYPYLALDSYARDETVSKVLLNLQRRYRAKGRAGQPNAARIAARAKQGLEAYVRGDGADCLRKLALLGKLARDAQTDGRNKATFAALFGLEQQSAEMEKPPAPEEILLAVFLVQQAAG